MHKELFLISIFKVNLEAKLVKNNISLPLSPKGSYSHACSENHDLWGHAIPLYSCPLRWEFSQERIWELVELSWQKEHKRHMLGPHRKEEYFPFSPERAESRSIRNRAPVFSFCCGLSVYWCDCNLWTGSVCSLSLGLCIFRNQVIQLFRKEYIRIRKTKKWVDSEENELDALFALQRIYCEMKLHCF